MPFIQQGSLPCHKLDCQSGFSDLQSCSGRFWLHGHSSIGNILSCYRSGNHGAFQFRLRFNAHCRIQLRRQTFSKIKRISFCRIESITFLRLHRLHTFRDIRSSDSRSFLQRPFFDSHCNNGFMYSRFGACINSAHYHLYKYVYGIRQRNSCHVLTLLP